MGRGRGITIAHLMAWILIAAVMMGIYVWSPFVAIGVGVFGLGAIVLIVGTAALARWIFTPPRRRGGPPPGA